MNQNIHERIFTVFKRYFFDQKKCFEEVNNILLPYKVYGYEYKQHELIVITIKKRVHCGISFLYNKHTCVLHASEKTGATITLLSRFLSIGTEIARYSLSNL